MVAFAALGQACAGTAGETEVALGDEPEATMVTMARRDAAIASIADASIVDASIAEASNANAVPDAAADPQAEMGAQTGELPNATTAAVATVGAHVWFDSSVSIRLTTSTFVLGWGGSESSSSSTCALLDRSAMTQDQLATLGDVTLLASDNRCTLDGHSYGELTVFDADGSARTYRDDGCLALGAADTMLPHDFVTFFPTDGSTSCPP